MKGTFTKRTAFPLIILILLSATIFVINYFEEKNTAQRDTELIESANETNKKLGELISQIDKLLEQNAEILKRLEAQNVTGNTASE